MGLYLGTFVVSLVAAAAVFLNWVANRKRIAAETIGRAEEQALRIHKDAERDADARRKEALLEAKEKAHELRLEAERQDAEKSRQLAELEQQLAKREAAVSDLAAIAERKDKELQTRAQAVAEKEKSALANS